LGWTTWFRWHCIRSSCFLSRNHGPLSLVLVSACEKGHTSLVKLLLADQRIDLLWNKLWSSCNGHVEVVKMF
jgi:hypothetical protein